MDKQGIITLLIIGVAVGLLFWTCRGPQKKDTDDQTVAGAPLSGVENDFNWRVYAADYVEGRPARLGSLDPASGYTMQIDVCPRGASIDRILLNGHFETVADKAAFDECNGNVADYLQRVKTEEDLEGFYSLVEPVGEFRDQRTLATERFRIARFMATAEEKSRKEIVCNDFPGIRNWERVAEKGGDRDENGTLRAVTYRFSFFGTGESTGEKLTLLKTYTIDRKSYSLQVETRIVNHTQEKLFVDLQTAGPAGMIREGTRRDTRYVAVGRQNEGQIEPDLTNDRGDLEDAVPGTVEELGAGADTATPVVWVGTINKYFGAFVYLQPEGEDQLSAARLKPEYFLEAVMRGTADKAWKPLVVTRDTPLPAGGASAFRIDFFAGPKSRKIFNDSPLYSRLRYVDTVSTRGCFCAWDWLREGLMWVLGIFSTHLFFGNYGLAIILLVAVVRTILHPLAKKGQVNMAKTQKRMAVLKPEMEKIKKKYANDKQTLNREMMKVYKQHGNPMTGMMLGCLPMLLQMPIWIALFTGLNSNVALRHEGLLPVWLTDLSAPDLLVDFATSFHVPLISSLMGPIAGFNLLPILLCAAMYLQSKYGAQAQASQAAATPEQASQQKMMRIMLPVMMLVFFYNAPAGLTLYIMASTTVGLIESRYIRKHLREEEEQAAATETVVKVSGKGPRGSRPKKPKGPFWVKRQ